MATAQREGGFYYTDRGVAVDANGQPIKGAPKPSPDTDPSKQPGAQGAVAADPMARLADLLQGKVPAPGAQQTAKAAASDEPAGAPELPVLTKLPRALKKLKSAEEVRAMQAKDDRAGAVEHYDARLAELEGEK